MLVDVANMQRVEAASQAGMDLRPTVENAANLGLMNSDASQVQQNPVLNLGSSFASGNDYGFKDFSGAAWDFMRSSNTGGYSALNVFDTQQRLNYHAANELASDVALQAISAAELANDPAAATRAAYDGSQQRIDNRATAREGLSRGGVKLSEAVDQSFGPDYYFEKYRAQMPDASEYDLARRVAKGVASSNWKVDLLVNANKVLGPLGVGYGAYTSASNIIQASPDDRPRVVAQEAGTWVGGWYGGSWGAALAITGALAVGVSPLGWGIIAAGAAGGGLLARLLALTLAATPQAVLTTE